MNFNFMEGFEKLADDIDSSKKHLQTINSIARDAKGIRGRRGLARFLSRILTKRVVRKELEKQAASRYAKELAKKFGGTPKQVSTKIYKELAAKTGKTGVEAFKTSFAQPPYRSYETRISRGNPLGLPGKNNHIPGASYVGDVLRHKDTHRNLGEQARKATIAKREYVRRHPTRKRLVTERGVGDLKLKTVKERRDALGLGPERSRRTPTSQIEGTRAKTLEKFKRSQNWRKEKYGDKYQ